MKSYISSQTTTKESNYKDYTFNEILDYTNLVVNLKDIPRYWMYLLKTKEEHYYKKECSVMISGTPPKVLKEFNLDILSIPEDAVGLKYNFFTNCFEFITSRTNNNYNSNEYDIIDFEDNIVDFISFCSQCIFLHKNFLINQEEA